MVELGDRHVETDDVDLESLYGLTDELVRETLAAIESQDRGRLRELTEPLHAADMADLFQALSAQNRARLEDLLGDELDAEVFAHLDEAVREDLIDELDSDALVKVVNELDSDDAVGLIEELERDEQRALLDGVPAADRLLYEQALAFPEDSAGRLMRREYAAVPSIWSVGETIDYMRDDPDVPEDFYGLFVVGPDNKPAGVVMTSRLLRSHRPVAVSDIMEPEIRLIPAAMDQEDVAFLFRQYGLVEAPVVDEDGRIIGVITVDDVVDVIDEEHEEDMLKLGGVAVDDLYEAVADTIKSRLSWLLLNLLTAILASIVIGFFQAEIEKVVALAVLMPIVASMGGNAGTQTLTVAVRALAMKELTPSNALRIVGKEVLVGGVNGIVFAVLMGTIAYFWFGDLLIGIVIGIAMILNLLVAGLAGILIPLAIDRAGADPAVGSSIVLTTVTDVLGFLCFLGLASVVLL
ncbi:MAG: magnesium transporter [Rhodospirillaceae bacterium]|nr:magnesium transporter [Rhodospirillaceae bacterium]